jgi:hypothetical protein
MLERAPVAIFRANASVPARFVTVLSAGDRPVRQGEGGRFLCTPAAGIEYAIALSGDSLLVTQCRDGSYTRAIAVGADSARLDGDAIACPPCWCEFRREESEWRLAATSQESRSNG